MVSSLLIDHLVRKAKHEQNGERIFPAGTAMSWRASTTIFPGGFTTLYYNVRGQKTTHNVIVRSETK